MLRVLLLLVAVLGAAAQADDCHCDVVLVLDNSGSILPDDWDRVKNFAKTIINSVRLGEGDDDAKIGIVTFSNDAQQVVELTSNKTMLVNGVTAMAKTTGTTRTDKGINQGVVTMSKSTKKCKTIKLVTDGMSNIPVDTISAASKARDAGIVMVAIGIGPMANKTELDECATAPIGKNSIALVDFESLETLAHTIFDVCASPPPPKLELCDCDIMLVIDASGSITDSDWIRMKDFCRIIVDGFEEKLSATGVRIGIITWANKVQVISPLSADHSALVEAIDKMEKTTGTTRSHLALMAAETELTTNMRAGGCATVKFVTDGQSNQPNLTAEAAYKLKELDNIQVVAVGIGPLADDTELTAIASPPYEYNRYHLNDFTNLSSIAHTIADDCDETPTTPEIVYDECHCDMVLILDASGSITDHDWERTKNFTMTIIEGVKPYLSKDDMRIGLITFANKATLASELSGDYFHLVGVVSALKKTTGTTRTNLALAMAHDILTKDTRGLGTCKTVKVVTDGNSNNASETAYQAHILKSLDYATVTAIGVGSLVEEAELKAIASSDDKAVKLSDYDALKAIADSIVEKCVSPTPSPDIPDKTKTIIIEDDCACDLILVMDASGSIMDEDWIKMQDFARIFINDMATHLGPTDKDVKISIITFANKAQKEIGLSYDKHALLGTITAMTKTSGTTRTWLGIQMAVKEFNTNSPGDKCKLMKVVTDGLSNEPSTTAAAAHKAKAYSVVMAIGVGWAAEDTELNNIASAPISSNSKHLDTFGGLAELAHALGDHCMVAGTPSPEMDYDDCHCDLMLVLDASGSITDADWKKMQDFATTVIDGYAPNFGKDDMRMGIVTYANSATLEIGLSYSKADLLAAVGKMVKTTGTTRTDQGLLKAYEELMAKNRGLGTCKTIKLVTDGMSNKPEVTAAAASKIKTEGQVTIFAVGIGAVNKVEINNTATAPPSLNTLLIDDFSGLDSFAHLLVDKCAPVEEFGDCHCDMVIVLDGSGSIADADWIRMKGFANVIIQGMRTLMDDNKVRIGVVQFSTTPVMVYNITTDWSKLLEAVNSMNRGMGLTYSHLGLQMAGQMLMTNSRSVTACKSIKFVTDGNSTVPASTKATAYRVHDAGINVMAIGVGPTVNELELTDIASAPKDTNMIHLSDFTGLDKIAHTISDKCTEYSLDSVCEMDKLIGCVIAKGAKTPCAEVDAYAACANTLICPDILLIWCETYFKTNAKYSACTNVATVCSTVNSRCKMNVYGECYAQQKIATGLSECSRQNKYIWCAESAVCPDLVRYMCQETADGSKPSLAGCTLSSCDHIKYQEVDLSPIRPMMNLPGLNDNSEKNSSLNMAVLIVGALAAVLAIALVAVAIAYRRAAQRDNTAYQTMGAEMETL